MDLPGLATWSFDVGSACIGFIFGVFLFAGFMSLTVPARKRGD